jgi:hypothetical protein
MVSLPLALWGRAKPMQRARPCCGAWIRFGSTRPSRLAFRTSCCRWRPPLFWPACGYGEAPASRPWSQERSEPTLACRLSEPQQQDAGRGGAAAHEHARVAPGGATRFCPPPPQYWYHPNQRHQWGQVGSSRSPIARSSARAGAIPLSPNVPSGSLCPRPQHHRFFVVFICPPPQDALPASPWRAWDQQDTLLRELASFKPETLERLALWAARVCSQQK